jgi:2-keto-3-deoxy-L-rhamnonate aldolase RhmA
VGFFFFPCLDFGQELLLWPRLPQFEHARDLKALGVFPKYSQRGILCSIKNTTKIEMSIEKTFEMCIFD